MERLQVAIEKARAQRSQMADRFIRPLSAGAAQGVPASDWQTLQQITLDLKHLRRGRINGPQGGRDSAPFDLLRTRMLQLCKQNNWRRVAIVSPHAGCGKSTTAANLAFSLARQSELSSMVFDFDLRRSGLSRLLSSRLAPSGIAEVLEEQARFDAVGLRHGDNLAFGLQGETRVTAPSELLQSNRTTGVLQQLEAQYAPDLMLFDMPPLMSSDDNFGFLQNVDCALILVAAEETAMAQIDVAERQVAELTNVLGVVLNKCRYSSGAFGHSYDYY